LKMRLLAIPAVSIALVIMMLFGSAQAYVINETGIITSQCVPINALYSPYYIATYANCSSWLHLIITQGRGYTYEWVTISDQEYGGQNGQPISVQKAGELGIYFQSYLTIQSIILTNDTPVSVSPTTLFGGFGFSYVVWYFGCSGTWSYSITTSYIPKQYYNSETTVTINATAGPTTNTAVCKLGT